MKINKSQDISVLELKIFKIKYLKFLTNKKNRDKKDILDCIEIEQMIEIFISFLLKEKVNKLIEINDLILDKYLEYLLGACLYDTGTYNIAKYTHINCLKNFFIWLIKKKFIKTEPFSKYNIIK